MKRNNLSRVLSLALATVMVAGSMAGCGSGNTSETTQAAATTASGTNTTTQAASAYTDYSAGFPNKVTIQIPVYDRAFEGWDVTNNYYTQWVQSEFGDKYNINVEYVAIGRSTEVQDYMQMIAAKTAPDIIMHYDMPQAVNYYGEGAMQELDLDEIAYYAPTYYSNMENTIKTYGNIDGKNTFFFAEREAIYYNWVTLIRQDWLDEVKMEMPTNLEELEAVATAWKAAGLGTLGDPLITKSFTYEYPYLDESLTDEEKALYLDLNVAPFTWAPTEKFLRAKNAQYNAGIMDQEFYLKTEDATTKADFVAGKTGTYAFYINSSTDVISSLLANDPNAVVATMNTGAGSPDGHAYYYEYPPYGMIMGINSTTSDEERAAVWMLLDWMSQPENLFYFQNGVEGENYTLDADGIAVPVADYSGASARSQNNNKDYWCLVAEVANYGDEDLNYKANLTTLAPAGYESLIEDSYKYDQENKEYGVITPIFTKVIEASGEYTSDLKAMWQEFYVDLVTCPTAEFDAKYEAYCKEYLDGGYQEILDEKQSLIDSGDYIIAN